MFGRVGKIQELMCRPREIGSNYRQIFLSYVRDLSSVDFGILGKLGTNPL